MGAGTHRATPWQDREWEIWGLPWISYPRVDRFYEIHEEGFYTGPDKERDDIVALNAKRYPDVPVYCTASRAHAFNNPKPFPLDDILSWLPIPYLEDSTSYMMAHAMHEGATEIGLYGVHMMGRNDYVAHRPSVTYLVGLAQGKGIDVTVPPGSPLFASRYMEGRYGITTETRF